MKFLLGLGVTNLATNRAVVKQLKDRLASAQDGSIDEYEEKEILSVLRQLKAQEDMLEKWGLCLPRATYIFNRLKQAGVINCENQSVLTVEQLEEILCEYLSKI